MDEEHTMAAAAPATGEATATQRSAPAATHCDDGYASASSSPHSAGLTMPSRSNKASSGGSGAGGGSAMIVSDAPLASEGDDVLSGGDALNNASEDAYVRDTLPLSPVKKTLKVHLDASGAVAVTAVSTPGVGAAKGGAGSPGPDLTTPLPIGRSSAAPLRSDGRETWASGADFLLSIIGFAVDLANVWRFPYLCYKNGGGAFLIPYTLMMVMGAVPLFYMELVLGQFTRQGPISVWRVCPLFKGVGFCAVLVAFYVSFYYNVIIGWALYFLVASAAPELPWLHCNNSWNTELCLEGAPPLTNLSDASEARPLPRSPAGEYFHRAVLEMQSSEGLHAMGAPRWQLVLCLLLVYSMLYLSLFKGVKSSGKVVWATATIPYVVLSILLIRGLMLPGAGAGIIYYLKPELARLADTQVWFDAAVQIFYSVGAGFGVHLSYASYNTFHNNCLRDCLVTTAVNCFTSFFSGFVIFTFLGFMSHKQGIPISEVATEGPGLVFQVYPEAVATLPGSNFWSMLFFFMLIMLGLDSAMGGMECVITGLMDEFRGFFDGRRFAREAFTLLAAAVSFSVALINVTPGGIYMFHLLDTYSAGISLLCSALFEAIAISWFYGLDRFSQDIEAMLGSKPGIYWRVCWKFISPSFIIGVVLFGLLNSQPLEYQDYRYPAWAVGIGWGLALSSIFMIPLIAIIQLLKTPGTLKQRIAYNITPIEEHESIRLTNKVSRFRCKHWLYV